MTIFSKPIHLRAKLFPCNIIQFAFFMDSRELFVLFVESATSVAEAVVQQRTPNLVVHDIWAFVNVFYTRDERDVDGFELVSDTVEP